MKMSFRTLDKNFGIVFASSSNFNTRSFSRTLREQTSSRVRSPRSALATTRIRVSAMAGHARGSSKLADVSGETTELLRGRDGASARTSSDEESGVSTTRVGRPRDHLEWSWAFVASYAAFGTLVVVAVTYSTYPVSYTHLTLPTKA